MVCSNCQRANLPGGVRCVYCGTHFPPAPDFELEFGAEAPPAETGAEEAAAPKAPAAAGRGLAGLLLLLLLKGKSLLALLKVGPLLTTFGSMAVFIVAEARLWGWSLAAGFAVSILIHELGHVVMNWRHGIKASAPMFIPFAGAVIAVKEFPADPRVESECGAGGPLAGMLAGLACVALAAVTGVHYWLTLANLTFGINLFNLIPFYFLDGARISTAFSPANWDFVLIALLLIVIKAPSAILWVLLIALFILRLGRARHGRFQLTTPGVRLRMSVVYLALTLVLGYGLEATQGASFAAARQAARSAGTAPGPAAKPGAGSQARTSAGIPPPPPPTSPSGQRLAQLRAIGLTIAIGVAATVGVVMLIGWLITCLLLARAAGEPFGTRGDTMALWMLAALGAIFGLVWGLPRFWPSIRLDPFDLLGGYLAATLAGLCYAAYQLAHAPRRGPRTPRYRLTWRCLAWAAGAALLVAYWRDSLPLAGLVLFGGVLFYAPRPWLVLGLAGQVYAWLGDFERAARMRARALELGPDKEVVDTLRRELAESYLVLQRGGPALEALREISITGPARSTATAIESGRASALALQDRYDEALRICEQILSTPDEGPTAALRPLAVRGILAETSLLRGWPDEARAQAEALLREVPGGPGSRSRLVGFAHLLRGAALAELDDAELALKETGRALERLHSPQAEARAALVRSRAALARGDAAEAEREAATALRRVPGQLHARYAWAQAIRALGREEEGWEEFRRLAAEFPGEHWGRTAAAELGGR